MHTLLYACTQKKWNKVECLKKKEYRNDVLYRWENFGAHKILLLEVQWIINNHNNKKKKKSLCFEYYIALDSIYNAMSIATHMYIRWPPKKRHDLEGLIILGIFLNLRDKIVELKHTDSFGKCEILSKILFC